jgi:hypothetical protein
VVLEPERHIESERACSRVKDSVRAEAPNATAICELLREDNIMKDELPAKQSRDGGAAEGDAALGAALDEAALDGASGAATAGGGAGRGVVAGGSTDATRELWTARSASANADLAAATRAAALAAAPSAAEASLVLAAARISSSATFGLPGRPDSSALGLGLAGMSQVVWPVDVLT